MPDRATDVRVRWPGHATAHVELPGLTFLTDPLFRRRLGPLRRHGPNPDPVALPAPDLVLISHAHPDHFDPGSLARVAGDPLVVVPRGLGPAARRARRPDDVRELAVGEGFDIGGWRVTAVPARHWRWPPLLDVRAVGYLLEGPFGVYFAGDTDRFPAMADLAGRADLALLPIGRWGPQPTPGHLTPASAARVAASIGSKVVVPIHWGTLYPPVLDRLLPAALREPADRFVRESARVAPGVHVRALSPGDDTRIDAVLLSRPAAPPPGSPAPASPRSPTRR